MCTDLAPHCISDLNKVIMDYLVVEGYPLAAQKFASEANMHSPSDLDSIQERVDIRMAIDSGDIQSAIEKINEFNPQVSIFFSVGGHTFYCFPPLL